MSISKIAGPQSFTPGYNPIWWVFDSTKKNEPNFRYRVEILAGQGGASATSVSTLLVPPAITTGYGNVELSTLLSSFLTFNYPSDDFGAQVSNQYANYSLNVTEQYTSPWLFQDTEFRGSTSFWNGYTQLTSNPSGTAGSMDPHPYIIGDQIVITDTEGFFTDDLYTVQEVPDIYTVVVSRLFESSPTNPGTTQFADRRTTLGATYGSTGNYIWNGAYKHNDWIEYQEIDYDMQTPLFKLLTTIPLVFDVQPTSIISLNVWTGPTGTASALAQINNGTNTWEKGFTASGIVKIDAGPGNIDLSEWTQTGGTATTLEGNYTFNVQCPAAHTDEYLFRYEDPCTKWGYKQLVFMDRYGSYGSFMFNYNSERNTTVNRASQKSTIGRIESGAYTYDIEESMTNFISLSETKTITVTTAWLTETEATYFQDLLRSPKVWITDGNIDLIPVNMITNTLTEDRANSKRNIRYTLQLAYSNNDKINW